MRTNVIVVVAPGLDDHARFAQADEHVFVQAFIAQAAVEALDESILYGLAGLDVVPGNSVDRPAQDRDAGQLGAVVADDDRGHPAIERQPFEFTYDAHATQRSVDYHSQAFAAEIIHDGQDAEAAAVAERVRDEVEAPALVDCVGQHHRRPRSQRPFTAAAPAHHQLLLAVQPIELLAIHRMSFTGQQPTETPVAEAPPLGRQLAQALTQSAVVRAPGLIAQRRMIDSHQPACAALTQAVLRDHSAHCDAPCRKL